VIDRKPGTICIVNEGAAFGGAEVHTLQLARFLAGRGHSVHIIECGKPVMAGHPSATFPAGRVHFHCVALSTDVGGLADMWRWLKLLRRIAPSQAILVKNWVLRGSMPFLLVMRMACTRFGLIEHLEALPATPTVARRLLGVIPRPGLWRYRDRLRRRFPSWMAQDVIAVSGKVASRLVTDCGYAEHKVHVARNGVEHTRFTRDAQVGAEFRRALGIPADRRLVTILARLEHAKGIDIALRAMAVIAQAGGSRPLHLLIAGTGVLEQELKELARSLGVADQVTFPGFLSDPKPALWATDCILFSSRLEGLPLGLLEGMAAGCLPVVTRISGMPEVITDPGVGWVVDPENPEALAAALRQMAALDAEAVAGYRERVVAHIRRHVDLERALERLVNFLGL
jgi:glycosyltransferase involved in cell wall biosynthesis